MDDEINSDCANSRCAAAVDNVNDDDRRHRPRPTEELTSHKNSVGSSTGTETATGRKRKRCEYNTRYSKDNPFEAASRTVKWRLTKGKVDRGEKLDATFTFDLPESDTAVGEQESGLALLKSMNHMQSALPPHVPTPTCDVNKDASTTDLQVLDENRKSPARSDVLVTGAVQAVYEDLSLMNVAAYSYSTHTNLMEELIQLEQPCGIDDSRSCLEGDGDSDRWDFSADDIDLHVIEPQCTDGCDDGSSNTNPDITVCMEDIHKEKVPLYAGANLTVDESVLAILAYCHRHNLNGEALKGLLSLIELHCPTPNECKKTLYSFRSVFDTQGTKIVHMICDACKMYIGTESVTVCPNEKCAADLSGKSKQSFFLEVSIEDQIKTLFQRKQFHSLLQHRFSREKLASDALEDIYDGSVYQSHSLPGGFLCGQDNISFSWNTDGVPLFKSSNRSLWPIYLVINELPYKMRMHPCFMIYAGLWCGTGKPNMATYLKPICQTLQKMYIKGVDVDCAHCNKVVNVRSIVLCGTCDLPARADVTNMSYFNGKNACLYCKQRGHVVASGRGHATTYPFEADSIFPVGSRTKEEFCKNGMEAFASGSVVNGVKGPTWLSCLPYFDVVNGTGVDYMHCVLTGTVKRLLHLWFDSSHHSEPYSLSKKVAVADSRLTKIKPPHFISRTPRTIGDHLAYWKANESRAWLLFYSIPVLHGVMPDEYFKHHILLIEAVCLLSKVSVSPADISCAENALVYYCSMYAALYGKENMTMNVHNLLHLPRCVRSLGPLWVYSCFSFENVNGKLLKFIHGPNNPIVQLSTALSSMLFITMHGDFLDGESKVSQFIGAALNKSRLSLKEKVSEGIYVLGSLKATDKGRYPHFISSCGMTVKSMASFQRASIHGIVVCSSDYTCASGRNSSTVVLQPNNDRAQIERFLKVSGCNSFCVSVCRCDARYFAVVRKFKNANVHINLDETMSLASPLMKIVHLPPGEPEVVPMEDIVDVCVYLESPQLLNKAYTFLAPNHLEGD